MKKSQEMKKTDLYQNLHKDYDEVASDVDDEHFLRLRVLLLLLLHDFEGYCDDEFQFHYSTRVQEEDVLLQYCYCLLHQHHQEKAWMVDDEQKKKTMNLVKRMVTKVQVATMDLSSEQQVVVVVKKRQRNEKRVH